jgi:uncharacterized protein (DUF2062 family)
MSRLVDHFKGLGGKLLTLRDTPHAIAGGVAIGVFVGFTPLFGIKTLLSLAAAYLLRCNPIAAVIAVSLHDIVTPIWPAVLRVEYDIGFWLLNHPHHLPPKLEMHHIHVSEVLKWTTFFHVGLPLLVGSLFLAAPAAACFYFLLLAILKARQSRQGGPSDEPQD